MTQIICEATTCKHNSAKTYNSPPGICSCTVIKLNTTEKTDEYDMKCIKFEWDTTKPTVENQ